MNLQQFLVFCGVVCLAGAGLETGGATMAADILTDGLYSHSTVYKDRDGGFASSLLATGRSAVFRMIHAGALETRASGDALVVTESAFRNGPEQERGCIFGAARADQNRYRYQAGGTISGILGSSLRDSRQEWQVNGTGIVHAESREGTGDRIAADRLSLIGGMNGWYRFMKRPDTNPRFSLSP